MDAGVVGYSGRKQEFDYKVGEPQDTVVIHTTKASSSQERSSVVRSTAHQALKRAAEKVEQLSQKTEQAEMEKGVFGAEKMRELHFATYNAAGGEVSVTEYFSDLGPEVNDFCNRVFSRLLPERVWLRKKTDVELAEHMKIEAGNAEWNPTLDEIKAYRAHFWNKTFPEDFEKGPTLSELVTGQPSDKKAAKNPEGCNVITLLRKWIRQGFIHPKFLSVTDLAWFEGFVKECGDQKIYPFLRGIRDNGDMENQGFYLMMKLGIECIQKKYDFLPTFGHPSVPLMEGKGPEAHKEKLFEALFLDEKIREFILDPKNQEYVAPDKANGIKGVEGRFAPQTLLNALGKNVDTALLKDHDGQPMTAERLARFARPGLMVVLFGLYHSLTFDIVLKEGVTTAAEINAINAKAKAVLGTATQQANRFTQKMQARNISCILLQECSKEYIEALQNNYHIVESGNTVTALSRRDWQDVTPLKHEHFNDKGKQDKLLTVKATHKNGKEFLFANVHGDAKRAEDGREKVAEAHRLAAANGIRNCVVAGDFNSKAKKDDDALRKLASDLGYDATQVGPSNRKCRADTTQRDKDGKPILTGGDIGFANSEDYAMVGAELDDPTLQMLPNKDNGSDHDIVYFDLEAK